MNAMQPPQSVEEVKATLETTEKGGVRQSIRNCLTVFQRDPVLAGAIAYNILTDRKDIMQKRSMVYGSSGSAFTTTAWVPSRFQAHFLCRPPMCR